MSQAERIQQSETRMFKAVFPNTTNHYDTLFSGTALQLMDEVAFITATRYSRQRMVTISSDETSFTQPISADTIIELVGTVIYMGNTSLKEQEKAISGRFTLVAIDEDKKPIRIQ
ncbi:MAG: hotdog domain-containing protein [Bacteroidota bacterium]